MDRRWLLGGLLIAGGVGVARAMTARPKLTPDSRVLLIGDSLAVGMRPHFQALAREEGVPFDARAVSGSRIDQWVESNRLLEVLDLFQPSHVLISLGTNDAYSPFEPEVVADNAEELLETIQEAGAHPIWIGAPDLPEQIPCPSCPSGTFDLRTDSLIAIEKVAPYYFDSTEYEIPRGPDGIHPTAAGYAGWAGAIWNWLT